MQVDSPQFRMADRLAGGKLAETILTLRDEGRSFEEISRRLYGDFGIEASRQTIVRWGEMLGAAA